MSDATLSEVPWYELVDPRGNKQLRCVQCAITTLGNTSRNLNPAPAITILDGSAICIDHLMALANKPASKLVQHAERELDLLGEDENFKIQMLSIVQGWADMGHSGGSHVFVLPMLVALLNQENLTDITTNPSEWDHIPPEMWPEPQEVWQNNRNSKFFSYDGGVTYWDVEAAKRGEPKQYQDSKPWKVETNDDI